VPNGAIGYAYFPYTYDAGSVLCGGPRYATLAIPITIKNTTTRVSFGSHSCSTSNSSCLGFAGCTYTNLTPRCNGGTLNPDFVSKHLSGLPGEEYNCNGSTMTTGLWGLDEKSICIYPHPTDDQHPHSPYKCLRDVVTGGAINGVVEVKNPPTPLFTPGQCTFNGKTQ
jgi:hypothetical protein